MAHWIIQRVHLTQVHLRPSAPSSRPEAGLGLTREFHRASAPLLTGSDSECSAVALPTSNRWFILPPPSVSAALSIPPALPLDDYMSAPACPGRGSTLNIRHTHTHTHTHIHAQQSLHQVWLIWLVTRVSRAITSIQMFHSPFVCAPYNTHTHTYTQTHTYTHTHTCFHPLPLPPVVEDAMRRVACCCFDYFSFASLSSLWAVTICSASEGKRCVSSHRRLEGSYQKEETTQEHTFKHTHTPSPSM